MENDMDLKGKLRQGLRIFGADNREYGTIDRYDDQYAYVGQRRIPISAFERMDKDRLYLGSHGRQYFESGDRLGESGEIRVPIHEERLEVERRQGEIGSVDIHKTVEAERVDVPVELRHEEVTVDRVDVRDRPVAPGEVAAAFEEGTIRVPVRGEQAVVEKEAVVTGEVVVNREVQTEQRNIRDTVRREEVAVDHDKGVPVHHAHGGVQHWDAVRDERRQVWERSSGRSGGRWEDVEPGHHYAHEMGADPRYRGRSWSEVEPHLKAGYGDWSRSRGYSVEGDPWARLHREVEQAWETSRQTTTGHR
jgi:uncharacterized protein (TIGR02271 family)